MGAVGPTGLTGPQGSDGATGATGLQGTAGASEPRKGVNSDPTVLLGLKLYVSRILSMSVHTSRFSSCYDVFEYVVVPARFFHKDTKAKPHVVC